MPEAEQSLLQRLGDLQQEARRLAQELLEQLGNVPDVESVPEMIKRWEQIEAIIGALQMSQEVLAEEDSEELKRCARQLRRYRRLQGHSGNVGWVEIRWVNGYGPYVYYRSRKPGERKLQTVYYGRMNQLSSWLTEELHAAGQEE
jgi:hypothetical protein